MKYVVSAAIQMSPTVGDVKSNIEKATELTLEAARKHARIIVLPELCTSGHTLRSHDEAMLCAQRVNGVQTQIFSKIAKSFNAYIAFGYVERRGDALFNSQCLVANDGDIVANYAKYNLWGSDFMWATPGVDFPPIVKTKLCSIGLLVCRDIINHQRQSSDDYDAQLRFYRPNSVDVVALSSNWGDGFGFPDVTWMEFVESVKCNLIVSNRHGDDRDMDFKGASAVIDRRMRVHTNGLVFNDDCVVGGVIEV